VTEKKFSDRLVVITGGAAGLGQTSALHFARDGADIVVLDIDEPGMRETAALVEELGSSCHCFAIDLADEAAIKNVGATLCEHFPRIDVLYNNAGIAYGEVTQMIDSIDQQAWLKYLSINTLAPLLLAKALQPSLANMTIYGATKAALNQFTYGMANVFAKDGIRVNAIAPGIMETPAAKSGLSEETYQRVQSMQLSKVHGTAEDIANLAVFLASDEGRFINCEVLHCDAGHPLRAWRN